MLFKIQKQICQKYARQMKGGLNERSQGVFTAKAQRPMYRGQRARLEGQASVQAPTSWWLPPRPMAAAGPVASLGMSLRPMRFPTHLWRCWGSARGWVHRREGQCGPPLSTYLSTLCVHGIVQLGRGIGAARRSSCRHSTRGGPLETSNEALSQGHGSVGGHQSCRHRGRRKVRPGTKIHPHSNCQRASRHASPHTLPGSGAAGHRLGARPQLLVLLPHGQGCIRREGTSGAKRLGRRLEEVAKAVGGGYCRLQMPLKLALGARGTVAGHRLGALEGGTSPRSDAFLPMALRIRAEAEAPAAGVGHGSHCSPPRYAARRGAPPTV